MSSDPEATNTNQINTAGGAFVDGLVNITGGDFVGRDKVVITEEVAYNVHGLTINCWLPMDTAQLYLVGMEYLYKCLSSLSHQ